MEVLPFYDARHDRDMMEGLQTFLSPMQRQKIQERVLHKHRYDRDRQYHMENAVFEHRVLRKTNSLNDLESFNHYFTGPTSKRKNSRTYEEIHSDNIEAARADSVASRVSNSYYENHISRRNSKDSSVPNSRISSSKGSVSSTKNPNEKGQFNQEKYNLMRGFRRNVYSDPNFTRARDVESAREPPQSSRENHQPVTHHRRVSSYTEGIKNQRIYVTMGDDADIIAINKAASKPDRRPIQNTQRQEKSSNNTTPRNTPPRSKESKQSPIETNNRHGINPNTTKTERNLAKTQKDQPDPQGTRNTPPKSEKGSYQSSFQNKSERNNNRTKDADVQPGKSTPTKADKVVFQSMPLSPTKRVAKPGDRQNIQVQQQQQQQQQYDSARSDKSTVTRNNEKNKPDWYSRVSTKNPNTNNTNNYPNNNREFSQNGPNKEKLRTNGNLGKNVNASENKQKDLQPIIKKTSNNNSAGSSSSLKKTNSFKVVGNSSNFFGYFSKEEEAMRVKKKVTFSNEDEERPETA